MIEIKDKEGKIICTTNQSKFPLIIVKDERIYKLNLSPFGALILTREDKSKKSRTVR